MAGGVAASLADQTRPCLCDESASVPAWCVGEKVLVPRMLVIGWEQGRSCSCTTRTGFLARPWLSRRRRCSDQCSWNVRRQGMPARQSLNRNRFVLFVVCSGSGACYRVTGTRQPMRCVSETSSIYARVFDHSSFCVVTGLSRLERDARRNTIPGPPVGRAVVLAAAAAPAGCCCWLADDEWIPILHSTIRPPL